MYLVNLVYASTRADDWEDNDIYQILSESGKNNAKSSITGSLCFNGDYFLQCLEGGRTAVNELYRRIHNDRRHRDVILLHYSEITQRSFEKWHMLYVPESRISESQILRYSGQKQFNPYQMSGASALQLCRELAFIAPEEQSEL